MTTKLTNILCAAGLTVSMMFLLSGCEKEGPAEKAGKKIDQAVEQTKENLQDAKETVEDKMTTQGPAEEAGEKIDKSVEKAKKNALEAKENVEEAVKTN